eukprot:910976_1
MGLNSYPMKICIAFGRPEFYSVSIISVTNREKRTKFQCHEDNLGKVINVLKEHDTIEMGKKGTGGFFKHGKPQLKSKDERPNVCCYFQHPIRIHSVSVFVVSYDLLMLTTADATCSETYHSCSGNDSHY